MNTASSDPSAIDELRAFAAQVRQDLEVQRRELSEVTMLVKQTAAEIDRLTPQRNDAVRRLREVEGSLDHLSSADIRRIYGTAQESQMRLFMMQGRLEQLEYKQRTLERSQNQVDRFVVLVEAVPEAPDQARTRKTDESATRAVSARVIQAQEDELHRVSRHVHDRTAQTLANLVLRVQICERLVESGDPRGRDELGELHKALASSLQGVRRLIFDLRPLVLEDLGLLPTLRRYIQALASASDTPSTPKVELALVDDVDQRLDPHVEVAAFRLIQEAVGNSLHHAQAQHLRVRVDEKDRQLSCTIEDDGVGFDVGAALEAGRQRKTLGLATMLDRAAVLGATVAIDSAPGRGTIVRITIPLAD